MKIKWFCGVCVFLFNLSSVNGIDTQKFFSKNSKLNLYFDSSKTIGINVITPIAELKTSCQNDKHNFGVSVFSTRLIKNYSGIIKTGNLSTGGLLSKMGNPLVSSSTSPFSTGVSSVSAITANLPGYTSFTKPVSIFAEQNFPLGKINTFYSPSENTFAFSLFISFNPFKKLKISISSAAGVFTYKENSSSSWFLSSPYYNSGKHFCNFTQLGITWNKIYQIFSYGLYEDPFGKILPLYKSEGTYTTSHAIFSYSTLYNPNKNSTPLLTSSEKTLDQSIQIRSGLQYKYVTGTSFPIFVKTGIESYFNYLPAEDKHPFKLAVGVQVSSFLFSLTLSSYISSQIQLESLKQIQFNNETGGFQIKNSWTIWEFIPSLSFSVTSNLATLETEQSNSYKIATGLEYTLIPKVSSSGSVTITEKGGIVTAKKISVSLTSSYIWRKVNFTLKLSADNTF